ncbi:MAG: 3-phosphoshikimate 1-carboxyvinyltransferase [Deltaproteobacteria bacterium]|nr:3-phosphoshikimate 1-carboxyvinyltransferase [Deltaproteobacteria bacterium]
MTTWEIVPRGPLRGEIDLPGDKSVSHRALILNGLASGPARVRGLLRADDVRATLEAMRGFGVGIEDDGEEVRVTPPPGGLVEPPRVLDCGNAGTSMRLLAGVAAAEPFLTVLAGDASLSRRPMRRIVKPLRAMGAVVDGREDGRFPPLAIRGGSLTMTQHALEIASAQVKSCLLLAGRRVGVMVKEPRRSRDHTERMVQAMGATLRHSEDDWLALMPVDRLDPIDVDVPGDVSAAAFWLVAASIVPGSEVYLRGVGVNPTRTGVLDALEAMGADVQLYPVKGSGPEPCADLLARAGRLVGTRIDGDLALRCLDELPVLAVAAAAAEGQTVIADAAELRVKESDRIARVVTGLRAMGVEVEECPDGMIIEGGGLVGGGRVDATGDHRIAMAFAVAGLVAPKGAVVAGAEAVSSSYPQFREHLEKLRG